MKFIVAAAAAMIAFFQSSPDHAAEASEAHVHIGHIMNLWQGTPGNMGLLAVAEAEAAIALQHAELAVADAANLGAIKAHSKHVVNAIDPGTEPKGPGRGYGVLRSAAGIIAHVELAGKSAGSSPNIRQHGEHVRASADNVIVRGRRIVDLGKRIGEAEDATVAYALATEILALAQQITHGLDANKDGIVSWAAGEGGLSQARDHMVFMQSGEGLN